MALVRYYPTATTLPNGQILVTAGDDFVIGQNPQTFHEVFDPATGSWATLTNAEKPMRWYPFMFVIPDGRVFFAGQYAFDPTPTPTHPPVTPCVLDISDLNPANWQWEELTFATTPQVGNDAAAVMYAPGKILVAGGHSATDGQDSTWRIDLTKPQTEWNWQPGPTLLSPRHKADLVILADGTLFMVGGESGELQPELLDPNDLNAPWIPLAEMAEPRGYHSTALLLPDARVFIGGGGDEHKNAQIFSPPYLFKGPRPIISSAAHTVAYGVEFEVVIDSESPIGPNDIDRVTLVRLGSVTHSFDQNQRHLARPIVNIEQRTLRIASPESPNHAPPGHYMLFAISKDGVPSVAKMIKFVNECPECPADLTGPSGGGPDGDVNGFDLLALLGMWGECGNCNDCPADITGPEGEPDCEVNGFDLLALLAAWGQCAVCGGEAVPQSYEDCLERYPPGEQRNACVEWVNEREQYLGE